MKAAMLDMVSRLSTVLAGHFKQLVALTTFLVFRDCMLMPLKRLLFKSQTGTMSSQFLGVIFQGFLKLLDFALRFSEFVLPGPQVIAPEANLAFPLPVLAVHVHMSR
jgi:hypothetical protein